jgi:hypothetical protein
MSNNTMVKASNLYLARGYLTFMKLTPMTVKVLTSTMWTFCLQFQGKKIKRTWYRLRRLTWNEIPEENSFHPLQCSMALHAGCAPAVLRATKTATFRTYNLYIFLDNFISVNRLLRTFWPQNSLHFSPFINIFPSFHILIFLCAISRYSFVAYVATNRVCISESHSFVMLKLRIPNETLLSFLLM